MSEPGERAPHADATGNGRGEHPGAPRAPHGASPAREGTRSAAGALLRRTLESRPPAGPHFTVQRAGGGEEVLPLSEVVTVGRGEGADLALSDPGASRRHARLAVGADGGATVEDLGSKNGIRLNGARLPPGPTRLHPGDRLRIAGTELCFVDPLEALLGPAAAPALPDQEPRPPPAGTEPPRPLPGKPAARLLAAGAVLLAAGAALLACAAAGLAFWNA